MSEAGLSRLQVLELIRSRRISSEVGEILLREFQRTSVSENVNANDVAVIGMAGRFPDARNLQELWKNLASGHCSIREVPAARWDSHKHWDKDRLARDKTYCKWGAFLDGIDQFDPDFFNISHREARLMDPQQRLFLMEAWNALEDAGYSDRALDGANCGVYVGTGTGDYHKLLRELGVPLEGYCFTGMHPAVLASRISYYYNLRGPSIAVDTSCSSSLMAIHLACEDLRWGKCELALAGGVAVLVTPELHILASKSGMLSPTGHCRAFDDAADGFVPGEAAAAVVLKRLDKALRDGDHIYGVIAASGTGQDGKTNGITAPNGLAQTALEVSTYARFGINPADISYIECHGTGTKLGDPIEIDALRDAFAKFTDKRHFCAVGSIKTNIGHTLTAAGVAGLIKVLLCLQHRQLVPSLGLERENGHIRFHESPFYVNTSLRAWESERQAPRLAAISSFGFSGTNVHAVIRESLTPSPRTRNAPTEDAYRLYPISAKTADALRTKLEKLADWLEGNGARQEETDISYTLAVGRSHFQVRTIIAARNRQELCAQLRLWPQRQGSLAAPLSSPLKAAAEAYLSGQQVEWRSLYGDADYHRVSLPGYPFARDHFWAPKVAESAPSGEEATATLSAPLATRTGDSSLCLQRKFYPTDSIVHDHQVRGKPLLPAAGHVVLVYEALRQLISDVPFVLSRVVFLRPLFVEHPIEAQIVLKAKGQGRYSFEVQTLGPDGQPSIHSRGEALEERSSAIPTQLSLDEIAARCSQRINAKTLYGRFEEDGILYGAHFATVLELQYGVTEVLAKLASADPRRVSPEGMLDGAVQSIAALKWDQPGVFLPFSMERVEMLRSVPELCYSYARKTSASECEISITDASGNPCVLVEGMTFRESKEPLPTMLYVPIWREQAPVVPKQAPVSSRQRILIVVPPAPIGLESAIAERHPSDEIFTLRLRGPDGTPVPIADFELPADLHLVYFLGTLSTRTTELHSLDDLEQSQHFGVRALFRLAKQLLKTRNASQPLSLRVITNDVHAPLPGQLPGQIRQPFAASLHGLCKSLAKERPNWRVCCLDITSRELSAPAAASLVDSIVAQPAHPAGEEIVLRAGRAYTRALQGVNLRPAAKPPFRPNSVYLILGGARGIGKELALRLARKVHARLALIGRSPHSPAIDEYLRLIAAAGGEAMYLQADASDAAQMADAVAAAKKRFGTIHGVFHSALVLRDGLLETMEPAALEAVMAPKVRGAVAMVQALRQKDLDFIVFFSSAQSFSGNLGQANYAAASTFEDAYAAALRDAGWPATVVNWGYFGQVGAVATPEYRRRMQAVGIHSIPIEEGLAALESILAHDIPQAMPLRAEQHVLHRFGIVLEAQKREEAPADAAWDPLGDRSTTLPLDIPRLQAAREKLDELALQMLLRSLQEMGGWRSPGVKHSIEELCQTLSVVPRYQRLLSAVLADARICKYLRPEAGGWRSLPSIASLARVDLDGEKAQLVAEHPETQAHAELLWSCARSYPLLLRGSLIPTEVLFPNSSMERVQRVYGGNPVSDGMNRLVAAVACAFLERRPGAKRIKILEVGAGTGATTRTVLSALERSMERIEYIYTDVSQGILNHGLKTFAKACPRMSFKRLDIEQSPSSQGFVEHDYDLIIAANVLHATCRIQKTLQNVWSLLRSDGWLILNEITAPTLFATLTFGLLDGWWRFEDAELRVPGSPLLSTLAWQGLLREAHFSRIATYSGSKGTEDAVGQHVIVAQCGPAGMTQPAAISTLQSSVPPPVATYAQRPPGGDARAQSNLQQRLNVERELEACIAQVLGREDAELDPEKPFTEYGVDSIILVELVEALNKRLGVRMKATALFDHPTLRELAQFISDELLGKPVPAAPKEARKEPTEEPPERDLESVILERLAQGTLSIDEAHEALLRGGSSRPPSIVRSN